MIRSWKAGVTFATSGLLILAAASPRLVAAAPETLATRASASAAVMCLAAGGTRYTAHVRPSRCAVFGRGGGHDCNCDGVNLIHLAWRGWGRPTTSANGRDETLHSGVGSFPVRISLYGLATRSCGRSYTRMKVTYTAPRPGFGGGQTHVLALPACPRPTT